MSLSLRSAAPALSAAVLFGASTPLAKWLAGQMPPLLLAGLLYLGSGFGLATALAWRARSSATRGTWRWPRADLGWLLGATVVGGMLGPALLMTGLQHTSGASAALLLNLEAVFTAVIAWVVFGENADRRIVAGMAAIVAGGVLLSLSPGAARLSSGALLIGAACLCWAIDNNLTRRVSAHDPMFIACTKGLLAGACNTTLALAAGASWPAPAALGASLMIGLLGYGVSLTLFVVALRTLGAARAGAYFSAAPLFGVIVALAIWPDWPGELFWMAAGLMSWGIWMHLSERHDHRHTHAAIEHVHRHRHDEHHRHPHDAAWDGTEPHTHRHRHEVLTHAHPHYPDIHHRHHHVAGATRSR